MTRPRLAVDLRPAALLAAGVSGVLAADLDVAESGRWTLVARAEDLSPSANRQAGSEALPVPVVTVLGPIEQRATAHDPCGAMTDGYDSIESRFGAAVQQVARAGKGRVALVVDSPGGHVTGMLSSARRMRALAERLGVRVDAVADEQATSAGLALLLVGDTVNVPKRGRTASIGTVIVRKQSEDASKYEVIRSGERKMRPNSIEALNDEDRAELQAGVDEEARAFAQWVADRRGGTVENWLDLKGRSLSGEAACAIGLIDGNHNAHEVIEMALTQAALDSIAGALGLAAGASTEEIEKSAKEAHAARLALPNVQGKAAEADRKLLALQAEREAEQRSTEESKKRGIFVGELATARVAGKISPKSEAALTAHYDKHGEMSARESLATVLEAGVALAGGRDGVKAANQGGGSGATGSAVLTEEQRARAKELGATDEEYAAIVAGEKA